jgi:hypothetical protein
MREACVLGKGFVTGCDMSLGPLDILLHCGAQYCVCPSSQALEPPPPESEGGSNGSLGRPLCLHLSHTG